MRVGVIGPIYPDSFAENVLDCLPDLGVEAVWVGSVRDGPPSRWSQLGDVIRRARPSFDARLQRPLAARAIEHGCDLVIAVEAALLPETVKAIRDGHIRIAMWFPDALSNLDRQLMLVADYDRLFFKDALVVERLRAMIDLPITYLPEACNPHWHTPRGEPGSVREVVLAGYMYPNRVRLLDRMDRDGIPLRLYGGAFPGWIPERPIKARHIARSIAKTEKAEIFRTASGVLNNLHPSELSSVNCRLFEAAGCGAAVLCEARSVLSEFFEIGDEVLAFRSYEELRSQCRWLLDDADLVRRLGDAAAKRAHAEHTYQHRLKLLLEATVA